MIINDCYCIEKRLKELDKNYFLKYNNQTKQIEVWYRCGLNCHKEFNYDFKFLDNRLLTKIIKTQSKFANQIYKKMLEDNQKIERKQKMQFKDELMQKVKIILEN